MKKFIFGLALVVFLSSAGYIGYTMYQSYQNKLQAEELNNMFAFGDMDEGEVEIPADYPDNYSLKFVRLWKVNKDVRAFIRIDGTSVQYPIVQSYDNEYYLRRDFYEESNQHGVPFFDFRVDVERPSDNMVVYGHNMTDGQIFGELIKYKELDYYKEHPVIDFATVFDKPGEQGQYKIFSVFVSNAYENQGHVFDYFNFIQSENNEQFAEFIKQAKYRSVINTDVDAEPGDELITLSTCSYEFKDMRTVIVARKVRDHEDPGVDVDSATKNNNPLYPDVFYQKYGGSKPEGIDSYWTVGGNASAYTGYQGDKTAPAAVPVTVDPSTNQSVSPAAVHSSASAASQSASSAVSSSSATSSSKASSASSASSSSDRVSENNDEGSATRQEQNRQAAASSKAEAEAASKAAADAEASRIAAEAKAAKEAAEADKASKEAAEAAAKAEAEAEAQAEAEAEAQGTADADWMDTAEVNATGSVTPTPMNFKASSSGELTVLSGGSRVTQDALDVVASAVQNEVGPTFNSEAIKAQAVASYTYIAQSNAQGSTPAVNLNTTVDSKVMNAVSEVIGEAVYYKNQLAFTPYHATSAGATTSSTAVWGGSAYPYLVSVDSSVDQKAKGYKAVTTMTSDKVSGLLSSKLGIDTDGDPDGWFEVLSYEEGDYVGEVSVCGYTESPRSGAAITGRVLRESVLGLRSANFTIAYDGESDKFTFTTYGYGHGVGMSQNGANAYAAQGWDYVEILEHYYPGTNVK